MITTQKTALYLGITAVLCAALQSAVVRAELPPGSYDTLRDEAQEAITAKVLSVNTKELETGKTEVTAELEVTAVTRSKAKLKKGEKLTVQYVHFDLSKLPGFAGPRPVPILKTGKTYPAYLNQEEDKDIYTPAAYGESFNKRE